jgi:hypothetical protein
MPINNIPREKIIEAMEEFDRSRRGLEAWRD